MLTAADVRGKRFNVTKYREGYVQREVDAFLERVATTLQQSGAHGAVTPDEVVQVRFNPTKFSPGYDQDEVDDFLDEVVATLRGEPLIPWTPPDDEPDASGDLPGLASPLLLTLRVAAMVTFVMAALTLVLDLAPLAVTTGLLAVSLVGGAVVSLMIRRATAARGPAAGRLAG